MSRDEALRRLAPHLTPEELDLLRRRLDGEPDTEQVDWLERLVEAAAALPLVEVPPVLAQALRRQMRGPADVVEHLAVLRSDSRTAGDLVGVRGDESAEGWTWSFACEVADVLVDVWPRNDRRFDLDVQLIASDGERTAFAADLLGDESWTSTSDELGRTSFDGVGAGTYTIRLDCGDDVIVAELTLDVSR